MNVAARELLWLGGVWLIGALLGAAARHFLPRWLHRIKKAAPALAAWPGDGDQREPPHDDLADGADERTAPVGIDPTTGRPKRFAYAPNLVVVDGGLPQVNAAQRVLDELGIDDVALVGLAKRLEEVWLPGEEDPVILPRTSEGLYLLQRVRDEAHRFAITHHKSRRSKTMVESVLDDVPGLGEVRRKTLLRHFGSLRKLRLATVEEIAMVPGIGPSTATAIKDALAQEDAAPKAPRSTTAAKTRKAETHD